MKILAFDSSSKALSVAVVADGILLGEVTLNLKKNHSTTLMTSIDFLMAQVGLEAKELDRIAGSTRPWFLYRFATFCDSWKNIGF